VIRIAKKILGMIQIKPSEGEKIKLGKFIKLLIKKLKFISFTKELVVVFDERLSKIAGSSYNLRLNNIYPEINKDTIKICLISKLFLLGLLNFLV
jgi:hypothetical protein